MPVTKKTVIVPPRRPRLGVAPSDAQLAEQRAREEAFVRVGRSETPGDAPRHPETPGDVRGRLRASAGVVTRDDGRVRRRTTVYLAPETAAALAQYCAAEGREASAVVDRAVAEYLARAASPGGGGG